MSRKIFEESAFDPLEINKTSENAKIKALAVFVANNKSRARGIRFAARSLPQSWLVQFEFFL